MEKPLKLYIQSARRAQKRRRQFACVATALSVLVSGSVFWQLRGIGTAMVDKNLPTADDSGGDAPVTLLSSAELETPDIWEATLPPLTDIAGENIARIAESQLGYTESSVNFVHAEDGETHNGYTRYGAWYGSPYGDWNTMFTYFCMDYAGVDSNNIPYGSGCWAWSLELDKAELITPVTRGAPQRGDILLLDNDSDGKADRSCIVRGVSDDDPPEIYTIEGDVNGTVALGSYLIGDERFIGMVSLDGITAEPPVLPEEPAQLDFTAESDSGILVEAHADWGAFPFNTVMSISDISRDEAIQTAADQFGEDAENVDAVAVDITFAAPDGSELEPAEDSQVSVSISLPDEQALADGEFSLLHVTDDGDVHEVENADVSADGAEFTAESFSIYIVTSNGEHRNVTGSFTVDGHTYPNSSTNRYVVHVGESFTLYTEVDATGMGNDDGRQWFKAHSPTNLLSRNYINATTTNSYSQVVENGHTIRKCEAIYTAVNAGTATISVTGSGGQEDFFVKVLDANKQYYIWRDESSGRKPYRADELPFAQQTYANSEENPYIVFLGEEFDIFFSGDSSSESFSLPNNESNGPKKLDPIGSQNAESITYNSQTVNGIRRRFKALNPGTVYCQSNTDKQKFYIKVVDPGADFDTNNPSLYVKTSFEDKNIHEVKEWLNHYGLPKVNDHVPNSFGKSINKRSTGGYGTEYGRPYVIRVGDTFEIYANETGSYSVEYYDCDIGGHNGFATDLKQTNSPKISPTSTGGTYGATQAAIAFQGIETGMAQITFTNSQGKTQVMWVRVYATDEIFNHADMEIADGGRYTIANTSYENGQKVTTLKVYDAFVSRVNHAYLLDSSENPLPLRINGKNEYEFTSDGKIEEKTIYADVYGTLEGDYLKIGSQGGSQYELSSAYGRAKDFNSNAVKTVKFDVNITLQPLKQTTITDGVVSDWEDLTGDDSVIPNVIWIFDQQGIIDAMNKCPLSNGFDFTLRANAALIDLKAVKVLNGSDNLQAGQFEFQLYDSNNQPVGSTVKNDAAGNIVFLNQKYEETGTYTYTIREVVPTDGTQDPNMIYAADQQIQVVVTEINVPDGSGGTIKALKAEMGDPPTLTNYQTYTLPSTGGTGTMLYIIFGSAMISGALLLLYRRRKKEVAQ